MVNIVFYVSGAAKGDERRSTRHGKPIGLTNIGSTCYMNASIHALHTVYQKVTDEFEEENITCVISQVFKELQSRKQLDMKQAHQRILSSMGKCEDYPIDVHHDAHDFLQNLLDKVHMSAGCSNPTEQGTRNSKPKPETESTCFTEY